MKKTILFLAFGFAVISANAQEIREAEVPSYVKDGFTKLYPDAIVEKWKKENGTYEAEFQNNKKEMSATFSMNGQLIQTEQEINTKELPQGVTDYVAKNLNGKKITQADKITDNKGHISYAAEVNGEDYIFDSNCNYLKKEKESPDTDKD